MKAIIYRITLLEPTLARALNGDPNSAVAFDYLPGSALRGAIIGQYMRHHRLTSLDPAEPDIRRLFFDGTTRYLNGYLLDHYGHRSLPSPLSWRQRKGEADDEETELFDHALEPFEEGDETSWVGFTAPFCALADGSSVYRIRPARHIAVHTARTRRFGRAMSRQRAEMNTDDNPGAVYCYDALAENQTFESAILCDWAGDAARLLCLLDGEVTLGGSRSGGYGRACLQVVREKTEWREVDGSLLYVVDGKLVVTLLSDALVRDENGQFAAGCEAVTRAIEERLGLSLELRDSFLRSKPIGGFNRVWGLPLPQAMAIEMGSVLVYNPPACDLRDLNHLEALGIGERRAEGFGRVAVNWQIEAKLRAMCPERQHPYTVTITSDDSHRLAEGMASRMLRRRLDQRLIHAAGNREVVNAPSNAQLSRLRDAIRYELLKENPEIEQVRAYLEDIKGRSTPRSQFEKARIGEKSLLAWLEEILGQSDDASFQSLLGVENSDFRVVSGVRPQADESLRIEYLLHFIYAVLARTVK